MGHGVHLLRLTLAVVERRTKPVGTLAPDECERIPKIGRPRLIGHVPEEPRALAVLDFPERLSAELEVVALLIDRERTIPFDVDAALRLGDDVVFGELASIRLEADVRHALKRNRFPV